MNSTFLARLQHYLHLLRIVSWFDGLVAVPPAESSDNTSYHQVTITLVTSYHHTCHHPPWTIGMRVAASSK